MKVIVPPIKSQGIKTKLVPWIKSVLPKNQGKWIEPFLGTGVVGFNLAKDNAVFNDINPHIINFYKNLQSRLITPVTLKQYLQQEGEILRTAGNDGYDHYRFVRSRFNEHFAPLDFLFLSRAGFNGMMRFSKKGHWNIPFCKKPQRFSQSYVTKIVNQASVVQKAMKPNWHFTCEDFEKTIERAKVGDVIYCDPPYFGRHADYFNGWTEKDEDKLFKLLKATKAKFILSTWHHNSHRKNEMIGKYWGRFNLITKDHFYHTGAKIENRQSMVEALVCNFEIDANIDRHNHGYQEKLTSYALSL
jgi:DNA adenine methylase